MDYPSLDYEDSSARDLAFHYLKKEHFKSTPWGFLHLTLSFYQLRLTGEEITIDTLTQAEKDIARDYVNSDEYWTKPGSFEVLDFLRVEENANRVIQGLSWFRVEILPLFISLYLPDSNLAREELHRHVALEHFIARMVTVKTQVAPPLATRYEVIPDEYCLTD